MESIYPQKATPPFFAPELMLAGVGSTSNLTVRINTHLSSFKTNTSKCSSRFVLSNNYQISVLVDKIETKDESKVREKDFITAYGSSCVNINKPIVGLSLKEYQHNYQKNYRECKKSKVVPKNQNMN